MTKPPRKHTVKERGDYDNNQAKLDREASLVNHNAKQLKQEGISRLAESNRKRKCTNNDDDLSVVSTTDRPKELQGHNAFATAPHWETPKHWRQQTKHTDIYVSNMNNVGSPTSPIKDFPLAATRRTLVLLSEDNIGTQVCFKHSGIVFYGTVNRCFLND